MKVWMKALLASGFFALAQLAEADCEVSKNIPADEAVAAFDACLAAGHQAVSNARMGLGVSAFKNKNYPAAVKHFTEVIGESERPGPAFFNRGLTYLELNKTRLALKDFEAANKHLPDYAPAEIHRGLTLKRLRRYEQASAAFESAIALLKANPKVSLARTGFAEETQSGEFAEAEPALKLARAYTELARVELALRRRAAAAKNLDNAITADADFAPAYFERAQLHNKNGDLTLALTDYNQYLTLRPNSAEAYYNRGLIHQALRQDHLAIADFDRAIELNPRYLKARASKGATYLWPILPVLLVLMLG